MEVLFERLDAVIRKARGEISGKRIQECGDSSYQKRWGSNVFPKVEVHGAVTYDNTEAWMPE